MIPYNFRIKRPFFLTNFFTRPSNIRLGEWRFLLLLVQRLLVSRHKNIFLAFLLTSSNFFFIGSDFINNVFLKNLIFSQEVCFICDFSNFTKRVFTVLDIPLFLKGTNHLIFFDYMTMNWQLLMESFFYSSQESCPLEIFDLSGQFNFLFPVKTFSFFFIGYGLFSGLSFISFLLLFGYYY
jgi:hypothetical protein